MKEKPKNNPEQVYKTGPTAPPKSYGGVIAVLLVAVILLGGIASVLGIMNIRLLEKLSLEERDDTPIRFSPRQTEPCNLQGQHQETGEGNACLGITVEPITEFLQAYYDLPAGVYITTVTEEAAAAGCIPGDIITAFCGETICDGQALSQLLQQHTPGQEVTLTIFRAGEQVTLPIILTCEDESYGTDFSPNPNH